MADLVDMAAEIEAEHVARGLSRIARDIPVGTPGECEECGEDMPRLINGRCGFCRDGRRPPIDRITRPTPPVVAPPKENIIVSNPKPTADRRQISFPATGAILREIMRRAEASTMAQAVTDLLDIALAKPSAVTSAAPVGDLSAYETDELLREIGCRLERIGLANDMERDLAEATARAADAEKRLAVIAGLLAPTGEVR